MLIKRRRNEVEGSFGSWKALTYSLRSDMAKLKGMVPRHDLDGLSSLMCSEKVLRLLRLFFVLILGWLLGLYSLQEAELRGLLLSQRPISHDLLLCGIGRHRVAGCFGEGTCIFA